jgi:hypothetical protein
MRWLQSVIPERLCNFQSVRKASAGLLSLALITGGAGLSAAEEAEGTAGNVLRGDLGMATEPVASG